MFIALNDVCLGIQRKITDKLQADIKDKMKNVQAFLREGFQVLHKQPSSIEELSQSRIAIDKLNQQQQEYINDIDQVDKQASLLISRKSFESNLETDFGKLKEDWQTFHQSLLAFSDVLLKQKDNLRSKNEQKVVRFQNDIVAFQSRWQALKPKYPDKVQCLIFFLLFFNVTDVDLSC